MPGPSTNLPTNRRALLTMAASMAGAALARPRAAVADGPARVVVIGGGFAGATCARALHRDGHMVTLVEPQAIYVSCPMSNAVIAGLRPMGKQFFSYGHLRDEGIELASEAAIGVDMGASDGGEVRVAGGAKLPFDRLVMAPGIELRFDAIPGYDAAAAAQLPHAWKAGPETLLLRDQLTAMPDGGVVVMVVPANPYRCPPGPYERASLIAHYLKTHKPRAKLLVLDAKDSFSKQRLFQAAWQELYPGILEWVPLSAGGNVTSVDAAAMTVTTEFDTHKANVANVIPPQRAGAIAVAAGLTDRSGWCPIDPVTFESRQRAGIHVIGDAAIGGAMPKSAFAANAQAKICAAAVTALLRGDRPVTPKLINTCYSLVAPDYGISVAGVYAPADGLLAEIKGAGGTSPLEVPPDVRALEASYAEAWFKTATTEVFG